MRKTFSLAAALLVLALLPALAVQAQESPAPAKKAADPSVAGVLNALEYKYEVDEDGDYKLLFDADKDGKRTQLVFVRSNVEEYAGQRIREVWSAGYRMEQNGPFPVAVANRLLESSMNSKMGGWGKQGQAAIYIVRLPADAGKEALDAALMAALSAADEMEAELTPGKDDL